MKVFLDMDGVLVDFARPAFKLHGIDYINYPPNFGWDIIGAINSVSPHPISELEFWGKMDEYFWATLPKTRLCDRLVTAAIDYFEIENVIILTSGGSPEAACGKLRWIKHNLPIGMDVLIGASKHLLAGPSAILIDDCDAQVNKFREFGGEAILVPRPWNSSYARESADEYVLNVLDSYHYLLLRTTWGR